MKTVLNVKVDKKVKQKAQKVAAELGLPLSIVVNAHLRRFISERRITFAIPEKMSKKLEKRLGKIDADIRAKRHLSPVFDSAKEMDSYLNSL